MFSRVISNFRKGKAKSLRKPSESPDFKNIRENRWGRNFSANLNEYATSSASLSVCDSDDGERHREILLPDFDKVVGSDSGANNRSRINISGANCLTSPHKHSKVVYKLANNPNFCFFRCSAIWQEVLRNEYRLRRHPSRDETLTRKGEGNCHAFTLS